MFYFIYFNYIWIFVWWTVNEPSFASKFYNEISQSLILLLALIVRWWWVVFVLRLPNKRRLALFPVGSVVWDTHYRECPTRLGARFESAQNLSSGLVDLSCTIVITTTSRFHGPHTVPFIEQLFFLNHFIFLSNKIIPSQGVMY